MNTTNTAASRAQSKPKTIFGIGSGNAMEWFDWNSYATFAAFFAPQFFGSGEPVIDLLSTLAIFAVGFIARPFGGFLFGWIADRKGRQLSMAISVAMAAAGSLMIGLCPTYAAIGVAAPTILLVCRLCQGLAHGGELPASQTYLSEMAPARTRGLWASLTYVSGTIGVVAGTLLGAILSTTLTEKEMGAFGWRIPFIIGGIFGLYALYMRSKMTETAIFVEDSEKASEHEPQQSLLRGILAHPRLLAQVIGMTMGGTVTYYVWAVSAPAYAITVKHIDAAGALWAGVLANLVFIVALPIWGLASDRFGRKPVLIIGMAASAILMFPLSDMVGGGPWRLFVAMAVALIAVAAIVSILPAAYAEMFPTSIRAAGLAVPYSIAVALFGGTAPYVQTFSAERGAPSGFTWYAIALCGISILTVFTLQETKGKDLTANHCG